MIVPMPDDDLSSLARDIDARCRLRGTFTLRSGQVSDEYFDKYLFESDPGLLRRVTDALVPLVPTETELLGGGELGPEGIMVRSVLTKALLDSVREGLQCPRSRQTGRHASTYAARCSPVRVERASTRSAGVPSKTTRPPSWPAPGPKSIIQSACAITA
jgi:hypothetical protein